MGAVFTDQLVLRVVLVSLGQYFFQALSEVCALIGVNNVNQASPGDLIYWITQQLLYLSVAVDDDSLLVHRQNHVRSAFEHGAVLFLAVAQRILYARSLADVPVGDNCAHDGAFLQNWSAGVLHRKRGAVSSPEHLLNSVVNDPVPESRINRAFFLRVPGAIRLCMMNQLMVVSTDQIPWLIAKHLCTGRVNEGGPALCIHPVDTFAGRFQYKLVPPCELVCHLLHPPVHRYVAGEDRQSRHLSFCIEDRVDLLLKQHPLTLVLEVDWSACADDFLYFLFSRDGQVRR